MKEKNYKAHAFLRVLLLCTGVLAVFQTGCGSRNTAVYSISGQAEEPVSVSSDISADLSEDAGDPGAEESAGETSSGGTGDAEEAAASDASSDGAETAGTGNRTESECYVYVCGAVRVPGVYQLPEGSRVYQAVAAAGGMTEEAYERSLNQAEVLKDGQQITIFTREEAEKLGLDQKIASGIPDSSGSTAGSAAEGDDSASVSGQTKVNLNTATKEELMQIPGIGEAKAAAILQYREENGKFSSIEEVQNISGIKEKAFNKMKAYIEV